MSCEANFIQQLRDRGFRLTPQREMVLHVMHDFNGHATADEIFSQVHALSPAMDISTVYRTLELLQGLNMVSIIDLGDGQRRYELCALHGRHHHLHCQQCGKLLRVPEEEMQPLIAHLVDTLGFAAEPDHLVLPGLCADCRAAHIS